ncbi:hypothetical protein BG015_011971 [Linnemannia schmuckeri]|uniref:Galactose oxidase n=1 Tax=Linnemannia schmuckeri TaxID=64567 RepID=A0A9P5S4N6_9FUNG|nr:hypothetical protein BG015_011971 [Linnemannia schmuckeri]
MPSLSRSKRPPPRPLSLTSALLSTILLVPTILHSNTFTDAQATNYYSPTSVTGAAYARAGAYLFVLGGTTSTAVGSAATDQFMALDLSVTWPTSTPAWTQLQPGPKQTKFPAVFSKDFLTFYAFHIPTATSPPISSAYQYSVKTGNWIVMDGSSISGDVGGIGAITNPLTGEIICAGGCTEVGKGKVHLWDLSKPNLVNTVDFPQPFSPLPITNGAPPPSIVNHCMAANEDGLLVIVYGGQNTDTGATSGNIYLLNTATNLWSVLPAGPPRANAACTIVGDQLLLWGGTDDKNQIAGPAVLVLNHVTGSWLQQYTAPSTIGKPLYPLVSPTNSTVTPKPPNSTGPSTSPPTSTTSTGPGAGDGQKDDGSKGGLIGGIVAAIVVVAIIVGYVLYHRRQKQREVMQLEQQLGGGSQFVAATSSSTKDGFHGSGSSGGEKGEWNAQSERGRPQASTNNNYTGEGEAAVGYAVAGHQQSRAPQRTLAEYKQPPQAPQEMDDSEEFEQGLQAIENQQKQLDLKRQLLVLQQQQGQRVVKRTSTRKPEPQAISSVSSVVRSGGWPRPPSVALGPQYVAEDEYVPPPPPKAAKQYPTVQSYPDRPTSSNYGFGYATSESEHRGHNPQIFN